FELLSNIISAKIQSVQNNDLFRFREEMNTLYTSIVEDVYREEDLMSGIALNSSQVLRLLNAEGVAVVMNHRLETFGQVPDREQIRDLVYWLQANAVYRLYHQPSIALSFEAAGSYSEVASGLLALPVQPDQGHFVLAFRPEHLRTVSWGGNPNEAIRF